MANTKVTGDLIASSTIATGNIADNAVTSAKISGITTAHITEGSNLYYTDARARSAVSVSGNALSYNSSTGVITSNFEESPTFTGNVSLISSSTVNLRVTDGTQNIYVGSSGSTRFGLSSGASIIQSTSAAFGIGTQDGQNLTLGTNNTARLTILSAGNVGIGTSSPIDKLNLHGGSTDNLGIQFNSDAAGSGGGNGFRVGMNGTHSFMWNFRNTPLAFATNGSEKMTLLANGNLGIGTTSPAQKLHVASGHIRIDSGYALLWDDSHERIEQSDGHLEFFINNGQAMTLNTNGLGIGTASPGVKLDIVGTSSGSITNLMRIQNPVNSAGTGHGASLILHSTPDSNRGVAIASSSATNYATNNNMLFYTSSSSTLYERMRIDSNGQVGIGTTSPRNDANFVTLQVGSTATAASQIVLDDNDSNGPWRIISNQSLIINDDATERMRIESDGTVQITNSTSPKLQLKRGTKEYTTRVDNNNKFVIQEEGGNEFFVVESGASSNSIRIDSSGKVGIGTTNPQNKFVIKEGSNVDMEFGSEADGCFIQTYNRTTSSWGYLRFIAGGGERMRITRVGGEVLINQTSDLTGQIFQVNGMIDQTDVTKALRVYNGSTFLGGIGSGQWAISATYANDYALYAQNNLLFHAGTGSSIDMMIDANHNVGIATTSPSAKLHVNGVITANDTIQVQGDDSGFVCKNAAGTVIGTIGAVSSSTTNIGMFTVRNNGNNRIVLHANGSSYFNGGNVGIGTTSPSQKLDVSGIVKQNGANNYENILVKSGSTGTFTFTFTELNSQMVDNVSYFIFVSVYRPTTDVTNDVGTLLLHGIMPRGSNSTFNTINTLKGSGISVLSATNSGNSLVITTDSGTTFRCAIRIIAMGGTS